MMMMVSHAVTFILIINYTFVLYFMMKEDVFLANKQKSNEPFVKIFLSRLHATKNKLILKLNLKQLQVSAQKKGYP